MIILGKGTAAADALVVRDGKRGRAMLERAKERLRGMQFIYLTETLDADLDHTFGMHVDKVNVGP